MNCRNHPDVVAGFVAKMPAADKNPETGEYVDDVSLCQPCADRMVNLGFPVHTIPTADTVTDEQIVGVIAEHLLNVTQAVCQIDGVDAQRVLKCASRALVELDLLAAQEQNRDLWAAPEHGAAMTALDMLSTSLTSMRVQTPGRIGGFPLSEMYAQTIVAIRQAVEQHWSMLEKGGGPRLIVPGQNGDGS